MGGGRALQGAAERRVSEFEQEENKVRGATGGGGGFKVGRCFGSLQRKTGCRRLTVDFRSDNLIYYVTQLVSGDTSRSYYSFNKVLLYVHI